MNWDPQKGPTDKQKRLREAIAGYPWKILREPVKAGTCRKGEVSERCRLIRQIAEKTGVSTAYATACIDIMRFEEIGREANAQRARDASLPVPSNPAEMPSVDWFCGWFDAFQRLTLLVERLELLSIQRGDVWAESFLSCMKDHCERGKARSKRQIEIDREVSEAYAPSQALIRRG